jgi:hypothetical protein
MIRFLNGVPQAMFFSAHDSGSQYTWSAVQKSGDKPVGYVAAGTHATYPTPGNHDYSGTPLVMDYSNGGILWDVGANLDTYWYTPNPVSPGRCFYDHPG